MILLNLAVSMFVFEGFLCRHFFRSYIIYIITLALIYHAGMIDNYKLIIIILSYY